MTTRTLLLAAAALAIPCSAAHAIDFPVSTSAELTTALSTAQSNGSADRIMLAPGAYSGAFSYNSSEDLDVIGSGQNATEILGSGASNALDLFSSAATFHVSDLTVAMATNTPHGIWITGHGTIERTTVTMAAGATGTAMYVDAAGATVQHVEVDGGGTSSRGIQFEHAGAGTITDSTIYSTGYGVLADANGGSVTAARLNITGPTFEAVAAQFGASIAISDSL